MRQFGKDFRRILYSGPNLKNGLKKIAITEASIHNEDKYSNNGKNFLFMLHNFQGKLYYVIYNR